LLPDFVKTSKMTEALLQLENSMQQEGYKLGLETFVTYTAAKLAR
jgi:hypothetical protein